MSTDLIITPSDIKSHASWMSVVKCYLKYQKVMNTKLSQFNLTVAQHELLMNISHRPGCTQQQISDQLYVVKSNTSALLKKLSTCGYIIQKSNPSDARVNQIFLTPDGESMLKKSMSVQIELIQAMTAVLTDEHITNNSKTMRRIFNSMDLIQ